MSRIGQGIKKSVLTANSVLYAVTARVPAALSMAASRIVGRKSSGNIVALTGAELRTIIDFVAQARSAAVSDAVYGAGWDGVTTIAPSKNAVYDKIQTLGVGGDTIVWKDSSVLALELPDQTSNTAWTDLDLTAYTSANAKLAIGRIRIHIDSYTNGEVFIRIRKNGTTPDDYPMIRGVEGVINNNFIEAFWLIGLDASQVIEYDIRVSGTARADFFINIFGYIE